MIVKIFGCETHSRYKAWWSCPCDDVSVFNYVEKSWKYSLNPLRFEKAPLYLFSAEAFLSKELMILQVEGFPPADGCNGTDTPTGCDLAGQPSFYSSLSSLSSHLKSKAERWSAARAPVRWASLGFLYPDCKKNDWRQPLSLSLLSLSVSISTDW